MAHRDYPLADWDAMNGIQHYDLPFTPVTARYVRVRVTGHQLPKGHTGYGFPAWLFVDEIEVE